MANSFEMRLIATLTGKGFDQLKQKMKDVNAQAKVLTNQMNNALGGKPIENSTRSLVTNLGAVGNRLGFLAFQWKFMAGAAQTALQQVLGVFQDILSVGGDIQSRVGRALAFGTGIEGLISQSSEARAELERFQDTIVKFGSGATIFNRGEIADLGLELQKTFDDLDVTEKALPLATLIKQIDPTLDNEKLGTGLITLFEAMGTNLNDAKEMGKAVDFLSNVSDKSSLNFQSAISSLSKSAPLAKQLGFTATELGTLLQTSADVLGRNKSSGKAGSSAGTYTNAFLADLSSIADATTKQGKFARQIGLDLFEKDAKGGTVFKPLIEQAGDAGDGIITIFKKKFKGLSAADRSAAFSQLGLGDNSSLVANALIFDKTIEELQDMQEELREVGTLQARAAASVVSTGDQMKRFQAAVDAVKASIAAGLSPILKELADIMSSFTSDKEFNQLMASIGITIGDILRPALQTINKILKAFVAILKKNPKFLKILTTAVVGLVAALGGLVIISTIGFALTVMAASMATLTAQTGIATLGLWNFAKASFATAIRMAPFFLIAGAIAILLGLLAGIFDDDLVPAMAGLATLLGGLGVAMLIPVGNTKLLMSGLTALGSFLASLFPAKIAVAKTAVAGLGNTMDVTSRDAISKFQQNTNTLGNKIVESFRNIGSKISTALFGGPNNGALPGSQGFISKLTGFWQSLGKGGPILAAVAAAALIITAFILAMEKEVENSTIFKTGLVDKWQQVGERMTAATNVFLRQVGGFFVDLWNGITKLFEDGSKFINAVLAALADAVVTFFATGFNFDEAARALQEGLEKAFGNFDLGKTLGSIFDPTGLTGFTIALEKQLAALKEGGFNRTDAVVGTAIAELIEAWEIAAEDFGAVELDAILDKVFGNLSDQFTESQAQKEFNDKFAGENGTTGDILDDPLVQKKQEELDAIDTKLAQEYEDLIATQEKTNLTNLNNVAQQQATKIQIALSKLTEDQRKHMLTGIQNSLKYNLELTELQKALLAQNEETKKSSSATIDSTKATDVNTKNVDEETFNIAASSKSIVEHIDFVKQNIIEIARNINILSAHTTMVSKVNVMWANLIAEGNRAAGKLASLKVSSSGKFSITDPGISEADRKFIEDTQKLSEDTQKNQAIIDINALKEELEKIQAQLAEANKITEEGKNASTEVAKEISEVNNAKTQDFYNPYGNSNYVPARLITHGKDGPIQIDLNIDESIDLEISGGQLTQEQLDQLTQQLTDKVGSTVANQIRDAIGVEVL